MAAAGQASRRGLELFVERIPWTVATNELKTYFSQFGPVKKCWLPFNKETGFHKGFCWIKFSNEESFTNALQKESHFIEGSKINVQLSKEKHFASQYMDSSINDTS